MELRRIANMIILVLLTTFLLALILFRLEGAPLKGLAFFEALHFLIAIPLLTVFCYWLLASKFDEFYNKLKNIENRFERVEKKLGIEEKTLGQETRELRTIVERIDKDVRFLKKKRLK